MAVMHISEAEFEDKVLKNNKPVFVDFYATWCGPCQMMAPILEEVSNENPDVDFVAIDTDEAEDLSAKYGVMSIPNMMLFKKVIYFWINKVDHDNNFCFNHFDKIVNSGF